jgi:hypothetical protein
MRRGEGKVRECGGGINLSCGSVDFIFVGGNRRGGPNSRIFKEGILDVELCPWVDRDREKKKKTILFRETRGEMTREIGEETRGESQEEKCEEKVE